MRKIACLVFIITLVFTGQLIAADTDQPQQQKRPVRVDKKPGMQLNPTTKKAAWVDPYRFDNVSGGMAMAAQGFMQISILNTHETHNGFAEVEIHRAISDNPNAQNAKVRHTKGIIIPPKTMYYTLFYRRDDKRNHYPTGYWVKIRTSSEYLLPGLTNHMFNSSGEFSPVSHSYQPNDFAVFTRKPYKRIK